MKDYKGKVVDVERERVRLPDGSECELEVVRHPGGAAAVALDERRRVCLLRQYRPVARDWLWELPAGRLEPGEGPEATARRELQEEAGVRAGSWQSLGYMWSSPGVFSEVIHLYLAQDLELGKTDQETHELIQVHWLPLEQALADALTDRITDAKTIVGLLRARHLLRLEEDSPL